jgi:hypothetical protein
MRRHLLLVVAYSVGGALLGFLLSSIPSPHDTTVFWVGNFSSPWAVLPFLGGWSQRSWVWGACAGAAAEIACVMGFYARFLSFDPSRFGLSPSASQATVVATSVTHWVAFIAPWVLVAVGAGFVYGVFGAWWGRSRSIIAGVAVGIPFIAEPWLWPLRDGYFKGPLGVWVVEVAVGVAVFAWVAAAWRRDQARTVHA